MFLLSGWHFSRAKPSKGTRASCSCLNLLCHDRKQLDISCSVRTFFIFIFFVAIFTFPLNSLEALPSATFWTSRGHRWRPLSLPGTCLLFLSRIEFSTPTALGSFFFRRAYVGFSIPTAWVVLSSFANSRVRRTKTQKDNVH